MPSLRTRTSRVGSIDTVRVIAIFAVILAHTRPFQVASLADPAPVAAVVIDQAVRFSMSFFFVVSGFFWSRKVEETGSLAIPTWKMLKRLAFLFLAWSLIFLVPWGDIPGAFRFGSLGLVKVAYWRLLTALQSPLVTIMEGTRVHLWFLMSLLWCVSISALIVRVGSIRLLILLAAVCYVIGLMGKAYQASPIGIHTDFNFRNGPFFGLAPFVTGMVFQRKGVTPSWFSTGAWIAIGGAMLHLIELVALSHFWGTSAMHMDYVAGTYFYGVGVAMMALSGTKWLTAPMVAWIGPLVLGIYVSHMIFIDMLRPVDQMLAGSITWDLLYPPIVFLLSLGLSRSCARFAITRPLVM